jgi:hypothetical protein
MNIMKPNRTNLYHYAYRVSCCALALFAGLANLGRATPASLAGQIKIVSPASGLVVKPGDTVVISLAVDPGLSFEAVGIIAEKFGLGPVAATSAPPYMFSLGIPNNVIGLKQITAFGIVNREQGLFSDPITIDIEPAISDTGLIASPSAVQFEYAGQQMPLVVTGLFADGSVVNITESSRVTYRSQDPNIAIVGSDGQVTAIGRGSTGATKVVIGYEGKEITVPIAVPPTLEGDLNGDGRVDVADVDVILSFRGTPASGSFDARDLDHNGVIDERDARIVVKLCTDPASCLGRLNRQ